MIIPKTESLEIQIAKAKQLLSENSKNAIDAVNWKQIILGMNKKYNSEQLEELDTETELLLCGLTNTIDFPKELETRMKIPKVEVALLLSEMDKLIFKKMQEELEKRLNGGVIENEKIGTGINKPLVLDPRFEKLPRDVQESIAHSDWREKIYYIAKKYQINVEKMGDLENITVKAILNEIKGTEYEDAIRSKIDMGDDKIKEMVREINENIFKNIKRGMMNETMSRISMDTTRHDSAESDIPLPPYAAKKEDVVPLPPPPKKIETKTEDIPLIKNKDQNEIENIISNTSKGIKETDMYREHGIEIISNEYPSPIKKETETPEKKTELIIEPIKQIKTEPLEIKPIVSNIINDKLLGNTTSKAVISDYSLPKMNNQTQSFNKMTGEAPSNPHDPYHEEI